MSKYINKLIKQKHDHIHINDVTAFYNIIKLPNTIF